MHARDLDATMLHALTTRALGFSSCPLPMHALCSPGVEGVDVSMQLPGRAVIGTVREILAAMKVRAMSYPFLSRFLFKQ